MTTDWTQLQPGTLIEAVPTGFSADGSPITRPIRRRIDRTPWTGNPGSVVISDGTGVDAVNADSIRVIDESDQRVCAQCDEPVWQTGDGFADYTHADTARDSDHTAVVKLAHPMDADPFAGLDDSED